MVWQLDIFSSRPVSAPSLIWSLTVARPPVCSYFLVQRGLGGHCSSKGLSVWIWRAIICICMQPWPWLGLAKATKLLIRAEADFYIFITTTRYADCDALGLSICIRALLIDSTERPFCVLRPERTLFHRPLPPLLLFAHFIPLTCACQQRALVFRPAWKPVTPGVCFFCCTR